MRYLLIMLMAGCASIEPRTVSNVAATPVAISCLDPTDIPSAPAPVSIAKSATARQLAAAQEADLLALEQWRDKVLPLLKACSTLP